MNNILAQQIIANKTIFKLGKKLINLLSEEKKNIKRPTSFNKKSETFFQIFMKSIVVLYIKYHLNISSIVLVQRRFFNNFGFYDCFEFFILLFYPKVICFLLLKGELFKFLRRGDFFPLFAGGEYGNLIFLLDLFFQTPLVN